MSPRIASLLFVGFIAWLIHRDLQQRAGLSPALWIAVIWVGICGSRPISYWFGSGIDPTDLDASLEGSPMDRLAFLSLILASFYVIARRRVDWRAAFADNKAVFVFYLFFAVSVLWSDYPLVAFKRWFKEFGNILIILLILSEKDPREALKAVFVRCSYVLIPVSVLFVKYYPDLGRAYNRWSNEPMFTGITPEKNSLGQDVLVCSVFIVWDLLDLFRQGGWTQRRKEIVSRIVLLLLGQWLLFISDSKTSLVALMFGLAVFFGIKLPAVRRNVRVLPVLCFAGVALAAMGEWMFSVSQSAIQSLGRDMTFTGRTETWKAVLSQDINPLFGTGFFSFWLSHRPEGIPFNQSHNGYIELYLDGGMLGICLLGAALYSSWHKILTELRLGTNFGPARLALFGSALVVNFAEASFMRLSIVWVALLMIMMDFGRPPIAPAVEEFSEPLEHGENPRGISVAADSSGSATAA